MGLRRTNLKSPIAFALCGSGVLFPSSSAPKRVSESLEVHLWGKWATGQRINVTVKQNNLLEEPNAFERCETLYKGRPLDQLQEGCLVSSRGTPGQVWRNKDSRDGPLYLGEFGWSAVYVGGNPCSFGVRQTHPSHPTQWKDLRKMLQGQAGCFPPLLHCHSHGCFCSKERLAQHAALKKRLMSFSSWNLGQSFIFSNLIHDFKSVEWDPFSSHSQSADWDDIKLSGPRSLEWVLTYRASPLYAALVYICKSLYSWGALHWYYPARPIL